MELKGMTILRLVVVLCMFTLANGVINIAFGNSECKEKTVNVLDQGRRWVYINSSCNCTIISNHIGGIFFQAKECEFLNVTGAEISNCNGGVNVTKNSKILLILKDAESSMYRDGNSYQNIIIHAHSNLTGLFSVSCGPALGSTTRSHNRLASTTSTIRDMYVIAAGSIVAVFVLIVFVVVRIRKSRTRIIRKEETRGITTQNNAAIGLEDSKNLGQSKQLSDNPFNVSYQENDDGRNSAFGNENQGSAEKLPENPLYHSCQVNKDKEESEGKKEKSEGEMASNRRNPSENVSDINAV